MNVVEQKSKSSWWKLSLAQQIFLMMFIGGLIGYLQPQWGINLFFLRDIFLNLIKSIIAPLVFSTIVVGIAGSGGARHVGRIGFRSLLYFEIVTTIALFIGLAIVNMTQPGLGIVLQGGTDAIQSIAQTQPKTLIQTIVHIFPSNIVDAMVRGDVLQIVAFAILFGFGISAVGEKAAPVLAFCDATARVMFRFTEYVMLFAPIGIGAAMAYTIGHQGLGILENLGRLVLSLYSALLIFVVFVLGSVALIIRLPIMPFLRAVREPFLLAFVTTSSESALPKAMENMERFGVPKRIVGFVMPAGYSFNLDGTTLYLAMASVFLMQAIHTTSGGAFTFDFGQQVAMMVALMITSKGVAAVPRASLVILLATATSFVPKEYQALVGIGVAIIFGVDEFMDMARTSVNLLGNCLATVVIARWEGVFDDEKARAFQSSPELIAEESLEVLN